MPHTVHSLGRLAILLDTGRLCHDTRAKAMLRDGLYGLHFQNNGEDFGSGVVSLRQGIINGGDTGFAYQGRLLETRAENESITVSLQMHVQKWNPSILSLIPGLNKYTLDVSGQYDPLHDTLQLCGQTAAMPGITLNIVAVRIADLMA
jgi:hypothetical protein